MITNFHGDPENQILILGAAPLSLFGELNFNASFLAFSLLLLVPPALGVFHLAAHLKVWGWVLLFHHWMGLRTFVVHKAYPYS